MRKKFYPKKITTVFCISTALLSESVFCSNVILPSTTIAKAVPRVHLVGDRYEILNQRVFARNGIALPNFADHDKMSEEFESSFKISDSLGNKYFSDGTNLTPEAEKYLRAIADKIFSRVCIAYDDNVMLPVSVYIFGIPNMESNIYLSNYKGEKCRYGDQASFYNRFKKLDDKTKRELLCLLDACDEIYEKEKKDLFEKVPIIKTNYEQVVRSEVNCFEKSEYNVLEEIALKSGLKEDFYKIMKHTRNIALSFGNLSDAPVKAAASRREIDTNCQFRLKMVYHNTLPIVDAAMKEIYGVGAANLDIINNDLNRIKAVYANLIERTSENVCKEDYRNYGVLQPEAMAEKMYLLATFGANRSSLTAVPRLDFFNNSEKVVGLVDFYANSLFSLENVYDVAKPLYEADGITSFDSFGLGGTIDKTEDEINFGILCSALGVDENSAKQDLLNEINKEADGEEKAFEFNDLYSAGISKEDIEKFINGKKNMKYRNVVLSTDKIGNIILFLLNKSKLHYYKDPRKGFSFSSAMSSKVDDDTVLKSKNALLAVFVLIDMHEHGLTTNRVQENSYRSHENDTTIEEGNKEISENLKALREREARDPRYPEWEQLEFRLPEDFENLVRDVDKILRRIGGPLEIDPRFKKTFRNAREVSSYKKSAGDLNRMLIKDETFYTRIRWSGPGGHISSNFTPERLEEIGAKRNWIIEFYNALLKHISGDNYGANMPRNFMALVEGMSLQLDVPTLVIIKRDLLSIETHLKIAGKYIPK